MQMKVFCLVVLGLALAACGAPPTMADIQQSMQEGQYTAAIQQISQALAIRGDAAGQYSHYELLMLKGECLLNLKSPKYASQAFLAAMKAAPDFPKANVALASAILADKSPKMVYVARTGGVSQPVDILPHDSRTQAIRLLYDDMRSSLQPRIDFAMTSPQLTPMIQLIPNMIDLYALEWTATGSAHESEGTLRSMGARAREMMGRELARLNARVNEIQSATNELVTVSGFITPVGLSSPQRQELTEIGKYVQQIQSTARDARTMAHRLGVPGDHWEGIIADSAELLNAVDMLLRR